MNGGITARPFDYARTNQTHQHFYNTHFPLDICLLTVLGLLSAPPSQSDVSP